MQLTPCLVILSLIESYRFNNTGGEGIFKPFKHSSLPASFGLSLLFSHSCSRFCTILHSSKTQPFSFQAIPHSLRKTTRGGVPLRFSTGIKMNPARTNSSLIGETLGRLHRHSTRGGVSPRPRFASPPPTFLVDYIDPILHRVGPTGRFPRSPQRPRS